MLALIEISINILLLGAIVLSSTALGLFINSARISKQRSAILKLESEMLQNHAEILHLQKELSEKDNLQSKTPIFSIHDNASDVLSEQIQGSARLSKKVSGGGKSTS